MTPKKLNPAKAVLTVVLVASAALTLLAGCGGGGEGDTPSKQNSHTQPSGSAPASSRALSEAADGMNLAACRDANCAVDVRVGDRLTVDSTFGVDSITVKAIGNDEITLAIQGTSSRLQVEGTNVSTSSSCVNNRCRDEGELSISASRSGRVNDIELRLAKVEAEHAALVLHPRATQK
ncbi:MAG: hypothetical protein DLM55_01685 [Acidimicrobiales bacterium]|nr:MAG: hypothetical protein DLM55_01685 [Acidimicrobiales bacterium]